jgi:hypothetical protein
MESVMKRHADRPSVLHKGTLLVALCAAALLVLAGGCGQYNDSPNTAGLTVTYQFDNAGAAPAAATSTPQDITFTGPGEPVVTVVVGAIVITHPDGSGADGAFTHDDVANLTDAQRQDLQDDAEQSVQYLSIVQLPSSDDTVEFTIPPANAGNWQIVAVGLRNVRDHVGDIVSTDPIWYGFTDTYMNGLVHPGDTIDTPIQLAPGCNLDAPPTGVPACGT